MSERVGKFTAGLFREDCEHNVKTGPQQKMIECHFCISNGVAAREATARLKERERCADLVEARGVTQGTRAEGADEPMFSMHISAEASLHAAAVAIRALGEGR